METAMNSHRTRPAASCSVCRQCRRPTSCVHHQQQSMRHHCAAKMSEEHCKTASRAKAAATKTMLRDVAAAVTTDATAGAQSARRTQRVRKWRGGGEACEQCKGKMRWWDGQWTTANNCHVVHFGKLGRESGEAGEHLPYAAAVVVAWRETRVGAVAKMRWSGDGMGTKFGRWGREKIKKNFLNKLVQKIDSFKTPHLPYASSNARPQQCQLRLPRASTAKRTAAAAFNGAGANG